MGVYDILVTNLYDIIGGMEAFETYQTPLSRSEILLYIAIARVQSVEQPICQQRDVLSVFLGGACRKTSGDSVRDLQSLMILESL